MKARGLGAAGPHAAARLPSSLKLAFGAPAFSGAAMAVAISVLMPRFYSDVVLAPLGYVAIAIAFARAFDALTDPFVGWLSDRTRTRWGRRKPYMACGTPLVALSFWALFSPPAELSPVGAAVWFGATFALFFLFATIVEIPHAALGAELSPDYNERSSLFGYRSLFIAAGTIVAATLPTVLDSRFGFEDERAIYTFIASLYGVLLIVLITLLLVRVPERKEFMQRASNPLVPGVRRALRNRPFRILLLAGIVHAIPAAIPAILMPYFVRYVLQPTNPGRWVGIFLVLYIGSGLLFVPLWMAVARRVGKLRTLIAAAAIGITASVFYFFAGPGDTAYAGCIYFLTGTVSMVGTFLLPAMGADVIDYDELRTGKRREAQFTAFWALIPKFVSIPGSSIPLAIMAVVGYVPNQVQSPAVTFWIAFMYSIFPAAFYLASLLIVMRYPISEAVHEKIRRGIAARAAGEHPTDPLTGALLPAPPAASADEERGWFLDYFSLRELRRAADHGTDRLVRGVLTGAALALGLCVAASWVAVSGIHAAESRPPLSSVFGVVTAGLAFTAFVFHFLRLRPARLMTASPLPPEVIQAHLEAIESAAVKPAP